MNEPIGEQLLELEVTDFGPIVEARIDLRPLTVFVGPSNTGKSYLAVLIYALHRFFAGDTHFQGSRVRSAFPFPFGRVDTNLSETSIDALLNTVRSMDGEPDAHGKGGIVLPPPVADALSSGFNKLAHALAGEVGRCFGVPNSDELTRRGRTSASRVMMRRRISNYVNPAEQELSLARRPKFTTMVPADIRIPIPLDAWDSTRGYLGHLMSYYQNNRREFYNSKLANEVLSLMSSMVLPSLVRPFFAPAYYLPADRTGVMHAHSVVVSALIASAPTAGLRPAVRTPMLSGVLADFLEQLIEIDRTGPLDRKVKRDLGQGIEDDILGGSVRVDRTAHIDYPRFAYRPRGWKDDLALANASSMVSELAPLVLYLRHMIRPGNVLIVEEPESHLHPAMQVALTRQLAALVRAGVRVIVTTHSEWLLEELANIVRRSDLPRAERDDSIALRPDQVGTWLFEPKRRPRGSVVREISLDDSGLYPSGYDEVATALHNEWADMSNRIEANS